MLGGGGGGGASWKAPGGGKAGPGCCRSRGTCRKRREKQRGEHQVYRGGQERRGEESCLLTAPGHFENRVELIQGAEAGSSCGPRSSLNFTVSQVTGHFCLDHLDRPADIHLPTWLQAEAQPSSAWCSWTSRGVRQKHLSERQVF